MLGDLTIWRLDGFLTSPWITGLSILRSSWPNQVFWSPFHNNPVNSSLWPSNSFWFFNFFMKIEFSFFCITIFPKYRCLQIITMKFSLGKCSIGKFDCLWKAPFWNRNIVLAVQKNKKKENFKTENEWKSFLSFIWIVLIQKSQ